MSGIDQNLQVGSAAGTASAPFAEPRTHGGLATRFDTLASLRAGGWAALVPVLLLAAFLNFYELSREGWGNTYYAAAVKSMLTGWHNFFFASFDPGGFVTVDKPPLGFWIQAGSAVIFGVHGWSLILPEALAGILSVALIYHLVRRTFGAAAGLLAALVLAVTPVMIAANRSNIVDSLLVLAVLLGAWAVLRAVETGQLRWLVASMALVGLGFNIKMLEAFLVVPAFFAVYLLGAHRRRRVRVAYLALAAVVLLAVSFSWATVVDLTPASQRPYVGSSQDNSEYNLILGYNGIQRLLPRSWSVFGINVSGLNVFGFGARQPQRGANPSTANNRPPQRATNRSGPFGGGPGGAGENGAAGPLRLLNQQLGGQAGWLLPLALIGIVAIAWQARPRRLLDARQQAVILWGVWLITGAVFFSVAGFIHSYYLVMLAPPVAALAGAGSVALWCDYRRGNWRGWLLPLALVGVGLAQIHLLSFSPTWSHRLVPAITACCLAAALVLVLIRFLPRVRFQRVALAAVTVGLLGLLIAPAAWAAATTLQGGGGLIPVAGPRDAVNGRFGFEGPSQFVARGGSNPSGDFGGQTDSALLKYLEAQQGSTRYLVAVPNANAAAPIILATGKPVMAMGGFTGSDPILTAQSLANLVANHTVRFFLLQGFGGFGRGGFPSGSSGATESPTGWVASYCSVVPSAAWQGSGSNQSGSGFGGGQLYDCAAPAGA